MSPVLARCAARGRFPALEVVLATTPEDLDALYRLRKQIYVDEMRIVSPDHPFVQGDRLVDPYDAWSANLLLRADGAAVGTVRLTEAARGPLEIDTYTDATARCPDPTCTAEVTRLMVCRSLRGSAGSALLLYGVWQLARSRSRYLLAAAKPGSLGRYYTHVSRAGMTLHPGRFAYGLTGCQYELLVADLGAAWSPRRALWRAWIGTLAVLAFRAPSGGLAFVRTGRLSVARRPSTSTAPPLERT